MTRSQRSRLPFGGNDKASLARQGNQSQSQGLHHNQTWRVCLCQPNDVDRSEFLRAIKRQTYQEALQVRYHFCQPLQPPLISASDLTTSSLTTVKPKHLLPSSLLNSTQLSMESNFYTTTAKTDAFTTTPSDKHIMTQGNNSPFVG